MRSGGLLLRWLLAVLFLAVCSVPVYFLPAQTWPWIALGLTLVVLFRYVTWENQLIRLADMRPLSRWDLPDYEDFRRQLSEAWQRVGLKGEPAWVVVEAARPIAMAVAGRRGLVIFTTGLLQRHPPSELLAIAGHELLHLKSRDHIPVVIGSTWLSLVSGLGVVLLPLPFLGLLGAGIILVTAPLGWIAGVLFGQRSRHEEYQADLTGALIASPDAMISALQRLEQANRDLYGVPEKRSAWSALGITQRLHASHPETGLRVAALQRAVERGELDAH